MKTTESLLFSNSTEMMCWRDANCDRCIKASTYNEKTDEYTKFRCQIDADIQAQAAGLSEVSQRSYNIVQNEVCPFIQTQRKTPKKRKIKGQVVMF